VTAKMNDIQIHFAREFGLLVGRYCTVDRVASETCGSIVLCFADTVSGADDGCLLECICTWRLRVSGKIVTASDNKDESEIQEAARIIGERRVESISLCALLKDVVIELDEHVVFEIFADVLSAEYAPLNYCLYCPSLCWEVQAGGILWTDGVF
jgi:hypothetical protein